MSVKWTDEQLSAVNAELSNIIVTAAAGAGKTQVLSERIVRRIINGADISRILVMTFTDAAAAEMKERITQNLAQYLRSHPQDIRIRKQLSYLPAAPISTIHSFCLSILRSNFFKLGLKASFRICDETEAAIIKLDAAEQALEEMYAEKNADFLCFADSFSSARNDSALIQILLDAYSFIGSSPFPDKWLDEALEFYSLQTAEDFASSEMCQDILNRQRELLYSAKALQDSSFELAEKKNLPGWSEFLKGDAETLSEYIKASGSWDGLHDAVFTYTYQNRRGKTESDSELAELRDRIKKIIEEIRSTVTYTSEQCAGILHKTAPIVNGLVLYLRKFEAVYSSAKRERNVVDFSDFEHMTVSLLRETDTAKEIRDRFDEIYIDEYQDSNEIQEVIFNTVSGVPENRPNVFMVGDIKQSIYGFRQTSPRLFLEKKKTYKEGGGEKFRKITLNKNFRSSISVINLVNYIFGQLMSEQNGTVDYTEEERLECGIEYPSPVLPELVLIEKADGEGSELSRTEQQAVYIAERIKSIVGRETVYDAKKNETRPARYSDIAVLLRSGKNKADIIEQVLTGAGIPCYSESKSGFFETAEVKTFLSLLTVIDNPQNDIPLISVMRSPIFSFNEDMLAQIRLCDRNGSFYSCIKKCASDSSGLSEKCRRFMTSLEKWRKMAEYEPCDELIDFLFEETGFLRHVSALPKGSIRAANLRLLFEKARRFEETSFRGLFNFIRFVENLTSRGSDFGEAQLLSENSDIVRIMTIHKSKGLEFPIVFLPDLEKRFNRRDLSKPFIYHNKLGIAPVCVDPRLRVSYQTPLRDAVKIRLAREENAEEMRVLYVAITRAKERLIMIGSVKSSDTAIAAWEQQALSAARGITPDPSSYLDWIGRCVSSSSEGFYKCPFVNITVVPGILSDEKEINAPKRSLRLADTSDEKLKEAFSYEYPWRDLWRIPSKISVSEVKRMQNTAADDNAFELMRMPEIKRPRFMQEAKALSAPERGTLVHFIMETIDLNLCTEDEVREFVLSLCQRNIITREAAAEVPCDKIAAFLNSPLGERIKKADRVHREEQFTMLVPVSGVIKDVAASGEKIIVQGIIDCYFFEDGKIVLLDFKTDKVHSQEAIKARYKTQLDLYAEALEKKYFTKVYEKFIYLFDNNGIIRL